MSQEKFRAFVEKHLAVIEPLHRKVRLAYWDATISGKKEDFTRYAELNVEYRKTYSDPGAFDRLKTWRDNQSVSDPLDRRHLDILHRAFLRNQLPSRLIEDITKISSEITNKFNVYRAVVDGDTLTSNQVRRILRESNDSARVKQVWEAEKAVGPLVRDALLELVGLRNEAAASLGFDNYYQMEMTLDEQSEPEIIDLFDKLEELTKRPFQQIKAGVDVLLSERFNVPAVNLRPWHYQDPYFQEAPRIFDLSLDEYFEDKDVVELVSDFFAGIGINVQDIVKRSDLYEKPGKEQHAYCMDADRKGDIRILANVRNDETWTGTMLHELGHAVYDMHIDPALPFMLRQHAHTFVTEGIAMFFGRLSKDVEWIQATAGITDEEKAAISQNVRDHQKLSQLVFARWCQVMVRFERELYTDPGQDLNRLWWELVESCQMITPPKERNEPDWATKIHILSAPVYYHNYMLGELLASQLDNYIQRHVLGSGTERQRLDGRTEVGIYLKDNVFRYGRLHHWDRLIRDATGEPLDPRYFAQQYVV